MFCKVSLYSKQEPSVNIIFIVNGVTLAQLLEYIVTENRQKIFDIGLEDYICEYICNYISKSINIKVSRLLIIKNFAFSFIRSIDKTARRCRNAMEVYR